MRKYDQKKVSAELLAGAQNTQNLVNEYYAKVTAAERQEIYDRGYEQALRDYKAGPFAEKAAS